MEIPMHPAFRFVLSSALLVSVSSLATAADAQQNGAHPSINYRALQMQATRQAVSSGQANEYFANPYRAYPPSCLNAPLPFGLYLNDPNAVSKTITLTGDPLSNDATERNYTENDVVTVFRVPCGGTESALLLEIDRPSNASSQPYPVFPGVSVGNGFVPRVASDPNTFYSTVYAYDPLFDSTVVVFENIVGDQLLNYQQALTVSVDNLSGSAAVQFPIVAYNASAYTANFQPLPLSGYQSGNFYDNTHGGEGIQVEVGETQTAGQYYITVAWYTFDDSGVPYWLFGQGAFTAGATSANLQMIYETNGGFAGNFTKATAVNWGTLTNVNFPDCNTMRFTYTANPGLPAGVPSGSGTKQWTRLTQINGLTCQ
jgi:hypothetical protein